MSKYSWNESKQYTIVIKFTDDDHETKWEESSAELLKKYIEESFISGRVISVEFVEPTS